MASEPDFRDGHRPPSLQRGAILGIAASSLGCLLLPPEEWAAAYARLQTPSSDLQPFFGEGESPEQVEEFASRATAGFDALRRELEAFQPDAVILVFSRRPGEDSGATATFKLCGSLGWTARDGSSYGPRRWSLARHLLETLVSNGFDLAWDGGESHLPGESEVVARKALLSNLHAPIISLQVNAVVPPLPSAQRCLDLGLALKTALAVRQEKVAIVALGGLSYDELGRWVDEPLDSWFLAGLRSQDWHGLQKLFLVDTDALAGRTGEIRSWIIAAAACGCSATVVDYFPARQAKAGVGFVMWRSEGTERP